MTSSERFGSIKIFVVPVHDQFRKIREQIKNKGANAVIPRRSNSVIGNADMDWSLYRHRHLVENAFARLKHFRGLATRYDKLKRNYESVVAMACGFLWLPM
jgi:transposase